MSPVAIAPAELTGVFLESTGYGIYFVLFIGCLYTLSGRHKRKRSGSGRLLPTRMANRPLFYAALVLFVVITTHWILELVRLFTAYVKEINFPGPNSYYSNLAHPVNVTKTGFYIFECLVADCVIVYRLWIVWNGNRTVCIFPSCSLFGFAVSGTAITYQFTRVKPGQNIFESECGRWITSVLAFTLATNLYCTAFIAFRIWRVNRTMKSLGQRDLTPVIMIVVESAAIYTFMSTLILIFYLAESNLQFTALNATIPVVGIAFSLIVVRVSLGVSHKGVETTVAATTRNPGTNITGLSHGSDSYRLEPISITVQRQVENDQSVVDFKMEDSMFTDTERHSSERSEAEAPV